jgi:TRAP-type C4-dicarboxylate transport system permease small subunit
MLSTLKTIDRRLARLEDLLIMVMMATLAVLLGLGVVLRYVFNNPLTWSEEIVVTFFVWMVMLGVPSALRSKMHIRIDILILRLSNPARRSVGYLACAAGLIVFLAAVYAGCSHTFGVWGSHTPMLGLSTAASFCWWRDQRKFFKTRQKL